MKKDNLNPKAAATNNDKIIYHLNCSNENLTSLEDVLKQVKGEFICKDGELISLEDVLKQVKGEFICKDEELISLVGFDFEKVNVNNKLTTLDALPEIVGGYYYCYCSGEKFEKVNANNKLTTLEDLPEIVGGHYYCSGDKFEKIIKWLNQNCVIKGKIIWNKLVEWGVKNS